MLQTEAHFTNRPKKPKLQTSSDQSIIYTGRKLRTEMRSNEDRMINLSAQSAKSVTLGALNNIDVASLRTTAIPDTAFTMLKLDQAGDDLFKSPQFLNWIQRYSSDKNARSDKENPGNGKDRNEITKELDKKIENLLTNPNLETYVTYMNLFNKYSPGRETTLVNTFVTFYGDEAVAKVIEAAKKWRVQRSSPRTCKLRCLVNGCGKERSQNRSGKCYIWKNRLIRMGGIWRGYEAFYNANSKNFEGIGL
ncbi:hypothetical protein AM587_10004474 [Phytophthora nicotianae]|uniref:Uncharacterized protein n=1 Tax=Phytophthora nicotianae TaxID=4792 RepID=A0A0W8D301_PHYNI|nr:hypothetical protein AM587_10004474 [Phytophthora nicotianae]